MWQVVDLGWCVVLCLLAGAVLLWVELLYRIPVI